MVSRTRKYRKNNTKAWQNSLRNYPNTRKNKQQSNVLQRMRARGALNMNNNAEIDREARERRNRNLALQAGRNLNESMAMTNKATAMLRTITSNLTNVSRERNSILANYEKERELSAQIRKQLADAQAKVNAVNNSGLARNAAINKLKILETAYKSLQNKAAASNRNISEAQNKLKEKEEQFRKFYESASDIAKEADANKAALEAALIASLSEIEKLGQAGANRNAAIKKRDEIQAQLTERAELAERAMKTANDALKQEQEFLQSEYARGAELWAQRDNEMAELQARFNAAAAEAERVGLSEAEKQRAIAERDAIQTSLIAATTKADAADKDKLEAEVALQEQKDFLEQEYARGEAMWLERDKERDELQAKLQSVSSNKNAEKVALQKALATATDAADSAEAAKKEKETQLASLTATLAQVSAEHAKHAKDLESLAAKLAGQEDAARDAATTAADTLTRLQAKLRNQNQTQAQKNAAESEANRAKAALAAAEEKLARLEKAAAEAEQKATTQQKIAQEQHTKSLNNVRINISSLKKTVMKLKNLP